MDAQVCFLSVWYNVSPDLQSLNSRKMWLPEAFTVTAMSVFLNNFNLADRGPGIFALNGSTAKPVRWDLSQVMVFPSIHVHKCLHPDLWNIVIPLPT